MKHKITILATLVVLIAVIAGCTIPSQPAPAGATTPAAGAAQAGTTAASGDAAADSPAEGAAETAPAADTAVEGEAAPPQVSLVQVVADAKVVPIESAQFSMLASGHVQQIEVEEGDRVESGALLIKLEDAQRQVGVAQAQANLQRAQANLAQVKAGAREQELAQAEAGLAAAKATYERLATAAVPGNIAAAQAGVAAAQASLQKVLEGPSDEAMTSALADLKNAEARLRNASSAYDQVKWRDDVGMLPESLALEQASIAYEASQARMNDLQNGATPATVAGARAGVSQAAAQLDTLKKSMPSDLAAAQAAVDQAQAQLNLLNAGARPEAVAIAEADVAAATASLQAALVSLSETELRAPFAGEVATVSTAMGQQISPGAPVLLLADTSKWEIETSDLTEFDVVGVRPGDQVQLAFDAIPDLQLTGTVLRIRPIGEDNRGDTVYKVVVTPDSNDERLLWNMTAVVTFGQ